MRRAKIIATIGPKTESEEMMEKLANAGMNIARINMSHGTPEWTASVIRKLRKVGLKTQFPLGIMIDTTGPEIRTSATEYGLEIGDLFKIAVSSACDIQEGEKHTFIDYQNLIKKVKKKDTIMIDNGLIALQVIDVQPFHIMCKVLNKGSLGKRKSINMPGIRTDLPSVTKKDIQDLKIGAKYGMDYVAQSFVRRKEDIRQMRKVLEQFGSSAMIIAKIEDQEGIDNMDEIINEADGIMVARGDLGVEIPIEEIPLVQKTMVDKCIAAGKPVIVATQLLESMITNPRPIRAEVTDVANAVFQKADCIMLSGETTKGEYPAECISTMHVIAKKVQEKLQFDAGRLKTKDVKEAITFGACINADYLDAKAIIVFSKTGKLLSLVAKRRPNVDIFVFTDDEEVKRKLMIYWGTFSFTVNFSENYDLMATNAIEMLKSQKFLAKGDKTLLVSDVNPRKNIEILEIREI